MAKLTTPAMPPLRKSEERRQSMKPYSPRLTFLLGALSATLLIGVLIGLSYLIF